MLSANLRRTAATSNSAAALPRAGSGIVRRAAHTRRVLVVGYRPWLVRHIGVLLVSLILVVAGQHEALTWGRAERAPVVRAQQEPFFSGLQFADVRIPNPARGPTGPEPPQRVTMPLASGARVSDGPTGDSDGGDRWSVMLRPPLS